MAAPKHPTPIANPAPIIAPNEKSALAYGACEGMTSAAKTTGDNKSQRTTVAKNDNITLVELRYIFLLLS
jgi:hypothetical protein